jgi:hypothetical protein
VVFLDEAVWAGDKKGDGVLKALITEPSLSLEAKFRDPITVANRLRIIVASNNEWAVPAGIGDRRWLILNVDNSYADTSHAVYFEALKSEIDNGGAAAMLNDLLAMDLSRFNVRDVPRTAAKAHQQALSLPSVEGWLYQVLQEGAVEENVPQYGIGMIRREWEENGLTLPKDILYKNYEDFSKRQRDYRPSTRSVWAKRIGELLGPNLTQVRRSEEGGRVRSFHFSHLAACREQFSAKIKADFDWEPVEPTQNAGDDGAGLPKPSEAPKQTPATDPAHTSPMATNIKPSQIASIAKDVAAAERFAQMAGLILPRDHG